MPRSRLAACTSMLGLLAAVVCATFAQAQGDHRVAAHLERQVSTGAGRVVALAAAGSTVAYSLDRGGGKNEDCAALRVWSIATGRLTTPTTPACGSEFAAFANVALAGGSVVWSELFESNHVMVYLYSAPADRRARAWQIVQREWARDGRPDAYLGALSADGDLVAFTTQAGDYTGGTDAALWAGSARSVRIIRHVTGWMDYVSVEGDHIALGYRNGRVEILRPDGTHASSLAVGTAPNGLELDDGNLIALNEHEVSVREPISGRIHRSRPLARPSPEARLEDARGDLVVYRSHRALRLLRLVDGRDVKLPAAPAEADFLHARFCDQGLVIASPHVVKLLGQQTLQSLLRSPG